MSILRGIIGISALIFLTFLVSRNRKNIQWRTVIVGLFIQVVLAIAILKVPFIRDIFDIVGKIFIKVLDFTREGSEFVLGDLMDVNTYGFIFLFQVLPTIIFFSALTSVLFYLGVIQLFVKGQAWLFVKAFKISGAEALSVSGNIFLGQTESPLMIKKYIPKMTDSEILLVMIGGMATIAGGVMAAYISFLGGEDPQQRLFFAKHLLTASVMAAPGAIVVSKILLPQTIEINTATKISQEKSDNNILEALTSGTSEGIKMAVNVGGMLLVFVAFIAMINYIFLKIGEISTLNSPHEFWHQTPIQITN
jgi:concentrative nucleoside transporter, CNT family